jgi:hypothetical protein
MSALPPKADMCSATGDVGYGPIADIGGVIFHKQKDRLAAVSPKSDYLCFDHAAGVAFRFLRHPNNPNAPKPVTKSGSAAGTGTVWRSPERPKLSVSC